MKNFWFVVCAVLMFSLGWYSIERDKNFALMDHCAARANDSAVGTQAVCVNDETEALSVRCVKGTVQITCTMNGWDYDYNR